MTELEDFKVKKESQKSKIFSKNFNLTPFLRILESKGGSVCFAIATLGIEHQEAFSRGLFIIARFARAFKIKFYSSLRSRSNLIMLASLAL